MKLESILAIAEFLGKEATPDQVDTLMDMARDLSIQDRETLLVILPEYEIEGFYTEMSMHDAEMGGLGRY